MESARLKKERNALHEKILNLNACLNNILICTIFYLHACLNFLVTYIIPQQFLYSYLFVQQYSFWQLNTSTPRHHCQTWGRPHQTLDRRQGWGDRRDGDQPAGGLQCLRCCCQARCVTGESLREEEEGNSRSLPSWRPSFYSLRHRDSGRLRHHCHHPGQAAGVCSGKEQGFRRERSCKSTFWKVVAQPHARECPDASFSSPRCWHP